VHTLALPRCSNRWNNGGAVTSYRFASPPQSSKGVIIAHATFNISAGRIEGINNKIKTLRRKGYGYPDDDYFFLKLFDVSRKPYIRNPSSHNVYD